MGQVIIIPHPISERLDFNPYRKSFELDVINATSSYQGASVDHGRSLIYEICQHLRNEEPLPQAWRTIIDQSDVKVDLYSCPMAAPLPKKETQKVTLTVTRYQTFSATFTQPLLQIILPYAVMGLAIFTPLNVILYPKNAQKFPLHWLLSLFLVFSGVLAALACVIAKLIFVVEGRNQVKQYLYGV